MIETFILGARSQGPGVRNSFPRSAWQRTTGRSASLAFGELRHHTLRNHLDERLLIHRAVCSTRRLACARPHRWRSRERPALDASALPTVAKDVVGADVAVLVFLGVPR